MKIQWMVILVAAALAGPARGADMLVIFGTHVSGADKGFSIGHFDTETGKLTEPKLALVAPAPAYFVIGPDGKHLYSCNELNPAGTLSAYSLDAAGGAMTLINSVPTGGGDPAFVSVDEAGKHALIANYQGGSIAAFAINADGSLGDRTAFIQHVGHSVDPKRQTKPYAHSIRLDPTNRFAVVCDLGLDRVFVYRYDKDAGTLAANDPPYAEIAPGSGPRHSYFHPNGHWVYVISEMASTITAFNWDGAKGTLNPFQSVSSLPADFKGVSTAAEITVHPNGKFLYASNRGDDSLAVFAIDADSGKLSLVAHVKSGGKTPRNFAIDPTGRWIVATNHGSNNALVFKIDQETGKLTQTGEAVAVAYPFCERFVAVP